MSDLGEDMELTASGAAYHQIVDMYNWWQKVSGTGMVDQYTLKQSETPVDNGILLYSFPATPHSPASSVYLVNAGTQVQATGELHDYLSAGGQLDVTGHSLGGHLASAFSAIYEDQVSHTWTYNGPGFTETEANTRFFAALEGVDINEAVTPESIRADLTRVQSDNSRPGGSQWEFISDLHGGTPGKLLQVPIEDLGDLNAANHSIVTVTDSLAAYNLLGLLDPSVSLQTYKTIFHTASPVNEASVERVVDAVQCLLTGDTALLPAGIDHRDDMYRAIYAVQDHINATKLAGLVTVQSSNAVSGDAAQADFLSFLSLYYLSPVSLTGDDAVASVLEESNRVVYDSWCSGQYDAGYCQDRAAALQAVLECNYRDRTGDSLHSGETLYVDYTSRQLLFAEGSIAGTDTSSFDNASQVHFGSAAADVLQGGSKDDHLYGGDGADTYRFNGNWGHDVIAGDLDGGSVQVNGAALPGKLRAIAPGSQVFVYVDGDGKPDPARSNWTFILDGNTLHIQDREANGVVNTIDIEHFSRDNNNFGILLQDAEIPAMPSGVTTTGDGFTASNSADVFAMSPGPNPGVFFESFDGDDIIFDNNDNGTLYGGRGSDTLYGNDGNDYLSAMSYYEPNITAGGYENETIGPDNAPYMDFRGWHFHGSETMAESVQRGETTLEIPDESNALYGGAGNDYLAGGSYRDQLSGGRDDDILYGAAGQDLLSGDEGNDIIWGDSYGTAYWLGDTSIQLWDGSWLVFHNSYWSERSAPDFIAPDVTQQDAARGYFYQQGHDLSILLDKNRDYNDVIDGGNGNDIIFGEIGSDVISGGSGNDIVFGDRFYNSGYSPFPYQYGFIGAYYYSDAVQHSFQHLGASWHGNDFVEAGDGNDIVVGGGGNDILSGGSGNDVIYGDLGIGVYDIARVGNAEVVVTASEQQWWGNDRLDGGMGSDTLTGEGGDDILSGGGDDDILYGDWNPLTQQISDSDYKAIGGNDTLDGGSGNDIIFGGAGNDTLTGGEGNDALYGEAGDDTYIVGSGDGHDFIVDTEGNNTLKITGAELDNGRLRVFRIDDVFTVMTSADNRHGIQLDGASWNTFNHHLEDGAGQSLYTVTTITGPASDVELDPGNNYILVGNYSSVQFDSAMLEAHTPVEISFDGNSATIHVGGDGDGQGINISIDNWPDFGSLLDNSGSSIGFFLHDNSPFSKLLGKSGNDVLSTGAGTHLLAGGAGDDTYHIVLVGNSHTIIDDSVRWWGDEPAPTPSCNILQFDETTSLDTLTCHWRNMPLEDGLEAGTGCILEIDDGHASVAIYFGEKQEVVGDAIATRYYQGIQQFQLADGTTLSLEDFLQRVPDTHALDNNTVFTIGASLSASMNGGTQDGLIISMDQILGKGMSAAGWGITSITDASGMAVTDTLANGCYFGDLFGERVFAMVAQADGTAANFSYTAQQFTLDDNGCTIFGPVYCGTFAVDYNSSGILSGGKGDDFLDAMDAATLIIDGGSGDDTIIGGTGSDTVLHRSGDGNDLLCMQQGGGTADSLVLIGNGMNTASDVHVTQDNYNLQLELNGETLTVQDYFHTADYGWLVRHGELGSVLLFNSEYDYEGWKQDPAANSSLLVNSWTPQGQDGSTALWDNGNPELLAAINGVDQLVQAMALPASPSASSEITLTNTSPDYSDGLLAVV